MWILLTMLVLPLVILLFLLLALRLHLSRAVPCRSTNRLTGRVVVITGAGSGIGKVTARECSRRGAGVVITCQNKLRAEEVAKEISSETLNNSVFGMQLDLLSLNSVEQFFKACIDQFEHVDILVNNAAYMGPAGITEDGFDGALQVNYLAHFYLTYLFTCRHQTFNKHKYFRVVNVTSSTHTVTDAVRVLRHQILKRKSKLTIENVGQDNHGSRYDHQNNITKVIEPVNQSNNDSETLLSMAGDWMQLMSDKDSSSDWWEMDSLQGYDAYSISKFFLQLFSFELNRLSSSDIKSTQGQNSKVNQRNTIVLSVNPGPSRTGLQRHLGGLFGKVVRLLALLLFRSPEAGAQSVIYCVAIDDEEAVRLSGTFQTDCAVDRSLTDRFSDVKDLGPYVWSRAHQLCERRVNEM